MYRADECPCCSSTRHVAYPAIVAPFLASYAIGGPPGPTRLLECDDCGLRYFEHRLDDSEIARLYGGYRGHRYYSERHHHEPWYTRRANDAIGGDPGILSARRDTAGRFLRKHLDVGSFVDVLDFGGDRGQFLPEGIGTDRFVYDLSDAPPVPGVTRIDETAMRHRTFDLVLLSHVLEHCSEPRAVLRDVRSLLGSPNSVLYVELPYERARLEWLGRGRLYTSYLDVIRRRRRLLTALDFYSTAFRVKLGRVPPLGFVKLHEHLNFFHERSLRELLGESGFDVVACETVAPDAGMGPPEYLVALARLRLEPEGQ